MDTNKIFIDMAQRAHEFAEMCRIMQKIPDMPLTAEVKDALDEYAKRLGLPKADPEAWREEYRKKQAAGVRFQNRCGCFWQEGNWNFDGNEEDYREVPQEVSGTEYARATPHAAERTLWKAQREAGTNEVWEEQASDKNGCWWDLEFEPEWIPKHRYRVKPMKLTARIVRNIPMTFREYETRIHDWEFFGTREEYRAECEKYGYVILSEIKEVVEKPKMVKFYMAMVKYPNGCVNSWVAYDKEQIITDAKHCACTIIGDIEEREVEA